MVLAFEPATARTRLHRARGRLRAALISLGWQPEPAGQAAGPVTAAPEEAR